MAERLILSERESGWQGDRVGRFWVKTGTIWILTKTRAVLPCSGLPSLRIVSKTVLPAPGSQLCTHRARSAACSPRSRPAGSSAPAGTMGGGVAAVRGAEGRGLAAPTFFLSLHENSFILPSMESCCLPIAYSLLFPALAAPAGPSPTDTPSSGMRTYLGRMGPRQGQALTSTYPHSTPTAGSCLCKHSALQDRRPRARSKLSPKKAGLHWPRRFVWPEVADRSRPGNCPHSGHSCTQTSAAASVSSVEKARM